MLKGGLVLIWELDMNLELTLIINHRQTKVKITKTFAF